MYKHVLSVLLMLAATVSSADSLIVPNEETRKKNREASRLIEVDGKPSPMLTRLIKSDIVLEVELTKIAFMPKGPQDLPFFTGKTNAKVLRVYRGSAMIGAEIEFTDKSIKEWKVGYQMLVFLDRDQNYLSSIGMGSDQHLDFVSAFGQLEGKLGTVNDDVNEAVSRMRKFLENQCAKANAKSEVRSCKWRKAVW